MLTLGRTQASRQPPDDDREHDDGGDDGHGAG